MPKQNRIPQIVAITMTLCATTACTARVDAPKAKIDGPGYEIKVNDGYNGGKHCPPGHAKKGWC